MGINHLFITDNLNTHMSESLVKFVAQIEGIDESVLGVKGKSGILKSMESRAAFLMDRSHQIAFKYTPKHCSWLNQIECWFSILTRRLLNRRSSFKSGGVLKCRVLTNLAKNDKKSLKTRRGYHHESSNFN